MVVTKYLFLAPRQQVSLQSHRNLYYTMGVYFWLSVSDDTHYRALLIKILFLFSVQQICSLTNLTRTNTYVHQSIYMYIHLTYVHSYIHIFIHTQHVFIAYTFRRIFIRNL